MYAPREKIPAGKIPFAPKPVRQFAHPSVILPTVELIEIAANSPRRATKT